MSIINICLLGTAVISCNPQVICSVTKPVELPVYRQEAMPSTDSHTHLKVGDKAPDFSLPSIKGENVRLSDLTRDSVVVISFVPSAFTPVCSEQWPGYNIAEPFFREANATLIGITVDNLASQYAWTEAMGGLWFDVLSDFYPHGEVASKYGILRTDGTSERALFVIDKAGVIRYIDVHDIHERPPMDELIAVLNKLND